MEWNLCKTLTNACQLLDGWHQDGTAWSEWDEQVRQNLSRHLSAACQTVAPTPELKEAWIDSIVFDHHLENDPHKIGLPVYMSADICKADNPCIDTDGQCTAQRVYVVDAEEMDKFLAGAAPAVSTPPCHCSHYEDRPSGRVRVFHDAEDVPASTPRCPKCGMGALSELPTDSGIEVDCSDCDFGQVCESVADFAQFFQPAPSPPPWISVSTPPLNTSPSGKRKWFWITDGELYDVAIWIQGKFMGHRELVATHWMEPFAAAPSPQGESK